MLRTISLGEITDIAKAAVGKIDTIYLHWSAGRYETAFNDYHINIDGEGIYKTHHDSFTVKLSHTYQRNTGSIGVSINACYNATFNNFGSYPPTEAQITSLATVTAVLCCELNLTCDIQHVMTHAEAADNMDGRTGLVFYGPANGCERWDLWFWPGVKHGEGGNILRTRIRDNIAKSKLPESPHYYV